MKRMGVLEEEGSTPDDLLLRYIGLFKGPLSDDAVKALTALCGLEGVASTSATQA
jgi:hypothetical protein